MKWIWIASKTKWKSTFPLCYCLLLFHYLSPFTSYSSLFGSVLHCRLHAENEKPASCQSWSKSHDWLHFHTVSKYDETAAVEANDTVPIVAEQWGFRYAQPGRLPLKSTKPEAFQRRCVALSVHHHHVVEYMPWVNIFTLIFKSDKHYIFENEMGQSSFIVLRRKT